MIKDGWNDQGSLEIFPILTVEKSYSDMIVRTTDAPVHEVDDIVLLSHPISRYLAASAWC